MKMYNKLKLLEIRKVLSKMSTNFFVIIHKCNHYSNYWFLKVLFNYQTPFFRQTDNKVSKKYHINDYVTGCFLTHSYKHITIPNKISFEV